MELQIQPLLQTHPADCFHIARAAAERQPVDGVLQLLIFRKLGLE